MRQNLHNIERCRFYRMHFIVFLEFQVSSERSRKRCIERDLYASKQHLPHKISTISPFMRICTYVQLRMRPDWSEKRCTERDFYVSNQYLHDNISTKSPFTRICTLVKFQMFISKETSLCENSKFFFTHLQRFGCWLNCSTYTYPVAQSMGWLRLVGSIKL